MPRLLDRVERAVGDVEAAALELQKVLGEGLDTDQKVQDNAQVGVVRAVQVGLLRGLVMHGHLLEVPEFLQELGQAIGALGTHGLGQVAEGRVGRQIQLLGGVVGQDEREHGVLCQVVERATGHRVEVHQVLKVGDLTVDPLLRRRRELVVLVVDAVWKVHQRQLVVHAVTLGLGAKRKQVRLARRHKDLDRVVLEQVPSLVQF